LRRWKFGQLLGTAHENIRHNVAEQRRFACPRRTIYANDFFLLASHQDTIARELLSEIKLSRERLRPCAARKRRSAEARE
jgi:hypothetical protein